MLDAVRQEVITSAQTVVVKVGTNVLTDSEGRPDLDRMQELADQIAELTADGRRVALVSSGAIGAGLGNLQLNRRPSNLRQLQACAAVGQCFLMQAYQDCFAKHGRRTAQILLTAGDFDNRARYLNARNTIIALFEWGVVPIINENDTVSVAEIRFGDNDHLAALLTNSLQAPLLILLTSVDGLYAGDPSTQSSAQMLTTVPLIDGTIMGMAVDRQTSLGSGGMRSKLKAARLATSAGESVIVANGRRPGILRAIFRSEAVGTLFLPHGGTLPAWKRWLGYAARPKGSLIVDAGAKAAVSEKGRSLLPIGVVEIRGSFHKGDVVSICDAQSVEFARGLTNYSSENARRVMGMRTDKIVDTLGTFLYEEIVHRDNLIVVES